MVWGNRSLMHDAVDDYGGLPRYMKPAAGLGGEAVLIHTFREGEDGR